MHCAPQKSTWAAGSMKGSENHYREEPVGIPFRETWQGEKLCYGYCGCLALLENQSEQPPELQRMSKNLQKPKPEPRNSPRNWKKNIDLKKANRTLAFSTH